MTRKILTAAELNERERENLLGALEAASWQIAGPGGAAEMLGLAPTTVTSQMKSLGIRRLGRHASGGGTT